MEGRGRLKVRGGVSCVSQLHAKCVQHELLVDHMLCASDQHLYKAAQHLAAGNSLHSHTPGSCCVTQADVQSSVSIALQDMQWQDERSWMSPIKAWSPAVKGMVASGALLVAAIILGASRRMGSHKQHPL